MKIEAKWIILGILTTGCRTGYEIKKLIDVSFSHFWKMSYGQIYPALKALVDEGYAVQAAINKEGEPERKEYTITESGKKKLQEWLAVPVQDAGLHKNELLVKLFFGKEMSRELAIQHVEEQERLLRLKLTVYEQIEKDIRAHPDAEFWLYTLDYGKEIAKAELSWCKKTKERIK
ncbi:PadR family transcriptional regulator [Alkalihalobacillus oceani]|uniref:PadR family transcriptional regulator n=1 Tax=Halalkalibacter oceani TaxID=1653776 RepID=A0A9X2IR23_9BACI|nr:PadR family transcriptional regulator [Halalkalibacter oceani]MCM3716481.1 PadR family transcriptional regulator [Halalkalibacter oceani]